ncbi:MAG TPA: SDR family NAD(P)-dependent oxidoreductase [Stellaceae bacterium]|nr:SDR family NAD(P)-dependent oxidoreductase [Stellaceae bacterium]
MTVAGKTIAITGAARGLGQEFARHLAALGANIVAGDINDCAATIELVKSAGGEGIAVRLDVTDPGSAQAMIAAGIDAFGGLHGLVNNAALYGALHGGRFDAIAEAEWDACMAVNVKGIWNCCKAAVAAMRQAGGGSIVNIASLAATYGMPFGLHYTASKAAVIGITRGLARELGRDNIRVNALAPSAVLTEGTNEFFGDKLDRALQAVKAQQTIQRNLVPADLAGTMAWLLSDDSAFITGQTIAIDGGTVML